MEVILKSNGVDRNGNVYFEENCGYKIIEIVDGKPKFMFCGLNGSRNIEMDTWLTAEKKIVKDGTSKTEYMSGFHVIENYNDMYAYAKRFKNLDGKYVIMVNYRNATPKPTKNSLALLADELYITSGLVECAIPLSHFKEMELED